MSTDSDVVPQSADSIDDISKEQLIEVVRGQAARIEKLEQDLDEVSKKVDGNSQSAVSKQLVNFLIDDLVGGGVSDYTADPFEYREHVQQFNDRFSDIESTVKRLDSIVEEQDAASGNSKDVAWQQLTDYAENLQGMQDHQLHDDWVGLYKDDIAKATGYGKRYAQDLIEEWGEEKEGADWRPYKRIPSSRTTEGATIKRKLLKIDLDVWGDDDD